ncbi:MAG: DMT family transporter [Chitinophagaceae bacterium]|nr:DMT family transporter [Chitinophagaceae bacterium]
MKTTTKAHLAVLSTNLFFSANYNFVKYISPAFVKPFALNLLRVGLTVVLFWTMWLFGKTSAGIKRKDLRKFLLCSLAGIAINQTLFIKGLTFTSTIHASLLILTTPLLISIFAIWVLKENITVFKIVGLALGITGSVILILNRENSAHAQNYLLGDILILINAVSYTFYFLMVKPLMEEYSPLHVIRWVFTFGFFMILPIGWNELYDINWSLFHWQQFLALALIVITGTFLAYYFNAYGLQHLSAGTAGAYIYTQPIFAVIIATIFFSETLSSQKILAGCLIFSGVYLVSYRSKEVAAAT